MRMQLIIASVLAFLAVPRLSHAQKPDAPSPRRDHHQLIRMQVANDAQLQALLALGAEPWSCVIGPGQQDFSVSPRVLQQMRGLGMAWRMLHPDVQALIDADLARLRAQDNAGAGDEGGVAGPGGLGGWFADFKTYPQIDAYLDTLVALQPALASRITVGTTIEGRPMYCLRLNSPNGPANKPAVLIGATQHAREWAAVMSAMYAADTLVRGYGSDARITALLDRVEIFIVPVDNPDGFEFTYAPAPNGDRMWRKNRRNHGDGNFGVDLNRNWSVDWGGTGSTSTSTGSEVYIGTAPFSEPESAALRDFILAHPQLVGDIDLHSYGQLVLQTWAYTNAENADYDMIDRVGTAMNEGIAAVHDEFYENGWGGSILYLSSGTMRDWTYGTQGTLGYTIEVRDQGATGFILPPEQIIPTGEEVFGALMNFTERVSGGAEYFFQRGLPATVIAGSPTVIRVDIRPTPKSTLNSASAKVWWRVGSSGAFTASALTDLGGNQYQATLPALVCGQGLQYYFEIRNAANVPLYSPANSPTTTHVLRAQRSALAYDFQAASGWTASVQGATAGGWQRGVPVNDPNWPYDPRFDADASGSCWLTGNALGNSDVDNGSVLLTSAVINVPSLVNAGERAGISYAYFMHSVSPRGGDTLRLDVSTTGSSGPYATVVTHPASSSQWRRGFVSFADLASLGITLNSTTVLRFIASDANPQSIFEAAIDDVRIVADCGSATCPADVNRDGSVNVSDLLAVITAWGTCAPPCASDVAPAATNALGAGDGQVNVADLLLVISGWGACP